MKIGKLKLLEKTVIGEKENPLLIRYILFRIPPFGVYLHNMKRSDYDRALHNHPWDFVSVVLSGGYWEIHDQSNDGTQTTEWRSPGSVLVRPAQWRHRFLLDATVKQAWTLVFVSRRKQSWGFFLPDGWCWWRKHNYEKAICEEEIIHAHGSD